MMSISAEHLMIPILFLHCYIYYISTLLHLVLKQGTCKIKLATNNRKKIQLRTEVTALR